MRHPFPRTWWIAPGRVLGGCFPARPEPAESDERLRALLDVGVTDVIDLQEEDELGSAGRPFPPYEGRLRALGRERGIEVGWARFPTRDLTAPTVATVRAALDRIEGTRGVTYVHCWGGHGRTGTIAGCWFREQGLSADDALEAIRAARHHDAYLREQPAPQTPDQHERIRRWTRRA